MFALKELVFVHYSLSCIIIVFAVHCILTPLPCAYLVLAVLS